MNFLPEDYILKNKYKVKETLAESDFSNVYIGKHGRKKIVIKECFPSQLVLRDESGEVFTEKYKQRFELVKSSFRNEANVLEKGIDKRIVQIEESFQENNTVYLILEYCKGDSLKKYILENEFSEEEILSLFSEILDVTSEIPESGYLHRDIKPTNIIVNKSKVKFIDFGSSIRTSLENGEYVKVTEGYSPIEMYSLKAICDYSTDVYSLSSLLYFMLNKLKPMDTIKRFYYPELLFEDYVSDNVKQAIEKGMSLEKDKRYKNTKELKKAIFG